MYLALANLVAIFHGAYLIFFLVALVFSVSGRLRRYQWAEALFMIWIGGTILSFLIFGGCILTNFEQSLRIVAGASGYTDGFIMHYLGATGIDVTYGTGVWLVVAPMTLGIMSETYWHRREILDLLKKVRAWVV